MDRFIFNKEKSINAILYIANRLKKPDIHKVFKILYFSDRESICKYGEPLTGDRYIAMHNGPVPSYIYDIVKSVRGDSYFQDVENLKRLFSVTGCIITPHVKENINKFSPVDIKILDNNIKECQNKSFKELTKQSHGYAWGKTDGDCEINISYIAEEAGLSPEEIKYVKSSIAEKSFLYKR